MNNRIRKTGRGIHSFYESNSAPCFCEALPGFFIALSVMPMVTPISRSSLRHDQLHFHGLPAPALPQRPLPPSQYLLLYRKGRFPRMRQATPADSSPSVSPSPSGHALPQQCRYHNLPHTAPPAQSQTGLHGQLRNLFGSLFRVSLRDIFLRSAKIIFICS